MNFIGQFIRSLTIPTGATSGQRITINQNNDGLIEVYNAAGLLVATIGGPSGNVTVGTPGGAQVVIGTVTGSLAGLGSITFLTGNSHEVNPTVLNAGTVNVGAPSESLEFSLTGPTVTGLNQQIVVQFNSQPEDGSANATLQIYTKPGNLLLASFDVNQLNFFKTAAFTSDIGVAGAILKTGNTWQNPTYLSTWASGTRFNNNTPVKNLRFRRDAEDNLQIFGCFQIAGVAPASGAVFNLPAGYVPGGTDQSYFPCYSALTAGGSFVAGAMLVQTSGAVLISSTGGFTPLQLNTSYYANGKVPMNNLP